jgi:hypothetical protein
MKPARFKTIRNFGKFLKKVVTLTSIIYFEPTFFKFFMGWFFTRESFAEKEIKAMQIFKNSSLESDNFTRISGKIQDY